MPKAIKEDLVPETHAMKAERKFIPTGAPSLVESVRSDLPQGDEPGQLIAIVSRQPALYSTFLGRLIAGNSYKAACYAIAIHPASMSRWLQQGAGDIMDGVDTFCSRLVLDVQRAAALAVGDAEERVHKSDPAKWLGRGPAKDFHKGKYWSENPNQPQQLEESEDNPLDPIPVRELEQIESVEDDGNKELEEAMKVLEGHQIITNPEFIEQARNQYRIQKEDKKDNG